MRVPKIIIHPSVLESADTPQGKFIQLTWNNNETWVFSTKSVHRYHNHILEWFCNSEGIPCHWSTQETLEVKSDQVQVLGGGKYSASNGEITLYDNSTAYGRFDSDRAEEKLGGSDHPWSGLQVRIKP
jgi:hypothetical protein